MTQQIALLRGINVSGKNKIRMPDLKSLLEVLGCESVSTYLQSGNVVYHAARAIPAQEIQSAILNKLGLRVPVLSFSAAKLARLLQENPYIEDGADPAHCYVTFLWETPDIFKASKLKIPSNESGRFSFHEDSIFVYCPNGYGRTKIHTVFFEKKLGLLATTRNWKTVYALRELSSL